MLHHPHGQIYAYPFVRQCRHACIRWSMHFHACSGKALLGNRLEKHMKSGENMVYQGQHAVAFVLACARYAYEVWISTITPVAYFSDLSDLQRAELTRALKTVLLKYDGLWQQPFPYLMAWHQAPTDGQKHPEAFLHAEFAPYIVRVIASNTWPAPSSTPACSPWRSCWSKRRRSCSRSASL